MILDTCFVEDVARNDPDAIAKAEELAAAGVPERLSVLTVYELYWGMGYVDAPRAEQDTVDAVLDTKDVYDATPEIARKAGRIAGRLSREGRPIDDPGDEFIAATAVVHDEPVLTRTVDHFERIPDLEIVTY